MIYPGVKFLKQIYWQQFNFDLKKPEGLCFIGPGDIGVYDASTDAYRFPEIAGMENNGVWNAEKLCWQYRGKMIRPVVPRWFFKPTTVWGNEVIEFEFMS